MSAVSRPDRRAVDSYRWALDPAAWAMESGATDIRIQPWQRRVLYSTAMQLGLLCSRQSGKSTVTSLRATHTAVHFAKSLTLILAPTENQAAELLRKCSDCLDAMRDRPRLVSDSTTSLEFVNGSRLVSLPGSSPKSIRGYSDPTLIIIDEAAYFLDEVYAALRPMMAQGRTKLLVLSTPGGRSGWFYNEWAWGGSAWERHTITAYECPHLSKEFLDQERAKDERRFRREYLCEFMEFDDQVFKLSDIDDAITSDVEVLDLPMGL
jgi:hypothetical protein